MKLQEPKAKENLLSRLRKIEGQVRGVENMVIDERDCREIIQQLTATRSALHSATLYFVQEYASHCLLDDPQDGEKRQELVENLVALLGKVT